MRIFIDSRFTNAIDYFTLVRIISHNEIILETVLKRGYFNIVNLEKTELDAFEIQFRAISLKENRYKEAVEVHDLINFENIDTSIFSKLPKLEYVGHKYNDTSAELTCISRQWMYAYKTKIKKTNNSNNDIYLVFDKHLDDNLYVGRVLNEDVEAEYEMFILRKQLTEEHKKQLKSRIKSFTKCFIITFTIFLAIFLLISRFGDWSSHSTCYFAGIVFLAGVVLPNLVSISFVKEEIKLFNYLVRTPFL